MLVHDICRFNALKFPDRDALIFETGERLSWRALEARIDRIADALFAAGVRQGDTVSCLAKNCMEGIQIYLAANKLGALYAPVNYRFAAPEVRQVVMDSRPRVFVTQPEFVGLVDEFVEGEDTDFVAAWWLIDGTAPGFVDLDETVATAPERTYAPSIGDDDPSWICYTGGTTGRPKGVLLSHKNMIAGAMNFVITCEINDRDVYFVAGALFHIALAVPFGYWLAGGKVVLANFEPARSLEAISREGVTQLVCTGTIFKMLVEEMEARPRETSIRLMFCGGAPVSPKLVERAMQAFGCGVSQIYGQTEVTLMGTYLYPRDYEAGLKAAEGTPAARRLNSVGQAAPMCLVRIVDDDMNPVLTGEVGEIVFAGDPVMLGYANMEDLTAETLKGGWLRTGDLGHMDEDGYVYLVDRKKDMIITGGENVYSSEVELVLCLHPAISEAVVIGIPDDHWGEAVLALVVPREGAKPDAADIRHFCREKLAGYKVPKRIDFIEALPRLPTGKIAKGTLREPYWAGQGTRIHGI